MALLAVLVLPGVARAATVVWTLIDVVARLDNDGRLFVAETHHLWVSGPVSALDREFGLGTDQAFVLTRLAWVDPATGATLPLARGAPSVAGRYEVYPRHVRWSLGDGGARSQEVETGVYRFEYEISNAVSPAWALPSGPGPLVREPDFQNPWDGLGQVLADWREAWPLVGRYRLDHDVLLPSRDGPGFEFRRIDYRLEYGTAWRLLRPEADIGKATRDVDYRVRPVLEYLRPGPPPASAWREAAIRLGSIAAVPALGALLWLVFVLAEMFAIRGWRHLDAAWMRTHLLAETPVAIARRLGGLPRPPSAEAVLSGLAGAGKIRIEVEPPPPAESDDKENDEDATVRLRLLVPRESLSALDRPVVDAFFPDGDESGTELLRRHYRDEGFDPDAVVGRALEAAFPPAQARRWSPIGKVVALALGAAGVGLHVQDLVALGRLPYTLGGALMGGALVASLWGTGWHGGRLPRRAIWLLLGLPVLTLWAVVLHLVGTQPLGVHASAGLPLLCLAWYQTMLSGARLPGRGAARRRLTDLARARRFGAAELRRPYPRLQDAWIPHLEALDLGPALERWRARHGRGMGAGRDLAGLDPSEALAGPRFTGRPPAPFVGPEGWIDGLDVFTDARTP